MSNRIIKQFLDKQTDSGKFLIEQLLKILNDSENDVSNKDRISSITSLLQVVRTDNEGIDAELMGLNNEQLDNRILANCKEVNDKLKLLDIEGVDFLSSGSNTAEPKKDKSDAKNKQ